MTTPTTTPGTRAPAPPDARRVRVAGAWATVAGYGGLFADRRVKLALQAARDFGEGRAPAAVLAHALIELARMTAEARAKAGESVWTLADARRVAAAATDYCAARAVGDALVRAFDPAGCLRRPAAVVWKTSWLTSEVVALARVIAGTGRPDLLPILADALQDAGCNDPSVLGHCRGPGPHAPECWVVGSAIGRRN
jgi:hypothetical protein